MEEASAGSVDEIMLFNPQNTFKYRVLEALFQTTHLVPGLSPQQRDGTAQSISCTTLAKGNNT